MYPCKLLCASTYHICVHTYMRQITCVNLNGPIGSLSAFILGWALSSFCYCVRVSLSLCQTLLLRRKKKYISQVMMTLMQGMMWCRVEDSIQSGTIFAKLSKQSLSVQGSSGYCVPGFLIHWKIGLQSWWWWR